MKCAAFVGALLLASSATADDYRVMQLEQDVRTLERHVQTLQRRVGELQQRLRSAEPAYVPRNDTPPASDDPQKWLNAAAWERVKPGMSELQAIEILGKPTALRPDAEGRRALLYTLEIGTTGFLTGSLSFEDGKVVAVQRPVLK